MLDNSGKYLLEGLVTNLFVVHRDPVRVQTAAQGVLPGSMRHLVLRCCEKLGVPITLSAPAVQESSSWCDMFLTSVTKPVCSVASYRCSENVVEVLQGHPITSQIRKLVMEHL